MAAPKEQPQTKIALIIPTYTYLAYGNVRVWDSGREQSGLSKEEHYDAFMCGPGSGDHAVLLNDHPDLGSSTYDHHGDGSPVHFSSWLRPLLNMRPKSVL